jgi:hypothetical protein
MASITIWSRLEPRTREFSMEGALQAQIRDAAWLLARQWQIGEFLGDDAGSPVSATIRTESVRLTSFRPGLTGAVEALAGHPPVEVHVQREEHVATLRDRVALGLRFEALLHENGVGTQAGAFRSAYPISQAPAADEASDAAAARLRALAAGHAADGEQLVADARPYAADLEAFPVVAGLPSGVRSDVADALARLIAHRDGLYSEPAADTSWLPDQLEHDFAVGSESEAGSLALRAQQVRSEQLDWHAFAAGGDPLAPPSTEAVRVDQKSFIPVNVQFRGMPSARWWNFEDGTTDFGKLDAEHVDLAKLVVMEFALVYGDDWFELPLPLTVGALCHVAALVVMDTFGDRTALGPTGAQTADDGRPWAMFGLTGVGADRDLLLLAPTLGPVLDGPVLEDVLFARDEMASLGWGIERMLQGATNEPVDGYELYRARLAADPRPPQRTRTAGEPPVEYIAGTDVPDNWIPLVPVQTGTTAFRFRRGLMGSPGARTARGRILEPWHPFFVADQAIPREGVQVTRRYRRTRWSDGKTYLWLARRAVIGKGESGSGLEFDAVRDVPEAAP